MMGTRLPRIPCLTPCSPERDVRHNPDERSSAQRGGPHACHQGVPSVPTPVAAEGPHIQRYPASKRTRILPPRNQRSDRHTAESTRPQPDPAGSPKSASRQRSGSRLGPRDRRRTPSHPRPSRSSPSNPTIAPSPTAGCTPNTIDLTGTETTSSLAFERITSAGDTKSSATSTLTGHNQPDREDRLQNRIPRRQHRLKRRQPVSPCTTDYTPAIIDLTTTEDAHHPHQQQHPPAPIRRRKRLRHSIPAAIPHQRSAKRLPQGALNSRRRNTLRQYWKPTALPTLDPFPGKSVGAPSTIPTHTGQPMSGLDSKDTPSPGKRRHDGRPPGPPKRRRPDPNKQIN